MISEMGCFVTAVRYSFSVIAEICTNYRLLPLTNQVFPRGQCAFIMAEALKQQPNNNVIMKSTPLASYMGCYI